MDNPAERYAGRNIQGLEGIFGRAFDRLLADDRVLFTAGVSERTLCGRLAMYLEELTRLTYPQHRADVEYNRTLNRTKRLREYRCDCEQQELQSGRRVKSADPAIQLDLWRQKWHETHNRITADLVLHSRGRLDPLEENLIAVEMKKTDRIKQDCDLDRCRLRRMTQPYRPGEPRAT